MAHQHHVHVPRSRRPRGEHPRWQPRSGTEPVTARSDLPLRLLLARIFVPLFLIGAVGFGLLAGLANVGGGTYRPAYIAIAALCAVLFVVALADLVVVLRRRRYERDHHRPADGHHTGP